MRCFHQLGLGAALLGTIAVTACEHAVADTVGPLDAETLAAAATEVSPTDLVADLGLEPGQQEQVTQDVESLHAAMLALHEALSGHAENMSEAEREALHRELEAQMQDVHEKHDALMGSLTEDERKATWGEIETALRRFEGPEGFVGPCELSLAWGVK